MNWKLVAQLSLFGLAMALATVFVVPSNVEPMLWLPIFVICAYLIAKHAPGKHFLHGLMLGIANSVWITGVHVLLFDAYLAHAAPRLGPDVISILVAGPLMPAADVAALAAHARDSCRLVRAYDVASLVHAADAVVCRGGYNSS